MLDNYDSDFLTGVFNSYKRLKFLAPTCTDLLLKCKWAGKSVDCSKIFEERLTNEGFCCTFNYVKLTENTTAPVKAMIPAGIGPDQGLTVLVNLSSADYFYPLKNFQGATALIFDPYEFADSTTGAVREVPLEQFLETRITLNALTKKAVEEVQR
jgi:acid-sensing ion channel, other